MSSLIPAARNALQERYPEARTRGRIVRLTVDVDVHGEREMVSLQMRDGALLWHCTCGQEKCSHALAALSLLAGEERVTSTHEAAERVSGMWDPPTAPIEVRTVEQSDQPHGADTTRLADILDDVLSAVVRSGIGEGSSPAIDEALERLLQAAPTPLPLGISRWVGRLKHGLSARDVAGAARVLDGATRLVEDLRMGTPDAGARQRIVSWLGALAGDTEATQRVSELTLFEIARERLDGVERAGIERRYLLDLNGGRIYREERAPRAQTASLGPCPRLIHVGLASIEQGAEPRRIRLLQYSTTPVVPQEAWNQLGGWTLRTWSGLARRYRDAVRSFPGLAEPFVVVSPDSVACEPFPVLLDESGRGLPLCHEEHPAELRFWQDLLTQRSAAGHTLWLAGRLVDRQALSLLPLGAGATLHGSTQYSRA